MPIEETGLTGWAELDGTAVLGMTQLTGLPSLLWLTQWKFFEKRNA